MSLRLDALSLLLVDRGDGRDHLVAFARKEGLDVNELASRMGQTIQIHHPIAMALERIGRQRIGHAQHARQPRLAQRHQVIKVLPGMLTPGEEQTDAARTLTA